MGLLSQSLLNSRFQILASNRRFKTAQHFAIGTYQELSKVPADIVIPGGLFVGLGRHDGHQTHQRMLQAEFLYAGLSLKPLVKRNGIFAVHINLLEAGELGAKTQCAEFLNFLVGARRLAAELIAREIQNFQTLRAVLIVKFIQVVVLRRKPALSSRIHNQQHLAPELRKGDIFTLVILHRKLINILGHKNSCDKKTRFCLNSIYKLYRVRYNINSEEFRDSDFNSKIKDKYPKIKRPAFLPSYVKEYFLHLFVYRPLTFQVF